MTRVAAAAIDIYSMVATLSRATYVLNRAGAEGNHDKKIVALLVRQSTRRVKENLARANAGDNTEIDLIASIANDVSKNQGLVQQHPLNI